MYKNYSKLTLTKRSSELGETKIREVPSEIDKREGRSGNRFSERRKISWFRWITCGDLGKEEVRENIDFVRWFRLKCDLLIRV